MRYLVKRVFQMFITVFLLSTVVFFMARLSPGDPLSAYYGESVERLSYAERNIAVQNLGLDKPLLYQYQDWTKKIVRGDFGISYKYKKPVIETVSLFATNTIILSLSSYAITFFFAVILALVCVYYQGKWLDSIVCKIGTLTASVPPFWIAFILILLFSVNLRWLPSSGAYLIGEPNNLIGRLHHLILPVFTLVISHIWYYAYVIRNKLTEETRKDYVLLCQAKGIGKMTILRRHCLKNVFPAILTLIGLSVPHLLGGTYIIEKVFSYPGLGSLIFESVRYHDYNLLMILTIITGTIVVFISFLIDIINTFIDPRLRDTRVKVL